MRAIFHTRLLLLIAPFAVFSGVRAANSLVTVEYSKATQDITCSLSHRQPVLNRRCHVRLVSEHQQTPKRIGSKTVSNSAETKFFVAVPSYIVVPPHSPITAPPGVRNRHYLPTVHDNKLQQNQCYIGMDLQIQTLKLISQINIVYLKPLNVYYCLGSGLWLSYL